jgi:hypothetical protein
VIMVAPRVGGMPVGLTFINSNKINFKYNNITFAVLLLLITTLLRATFSCAIPYRYKNIQRNSVCFILGFILGLTYDPLY